MKCHFCNNEADSVRCYKSPIVPWCSQCQFECWERARNQMAVEDYKPRFLFEITEEQKNRADRVITQYGLRKAIFSPILDDVLDIIEEYGGVAIGIMISGKVKPRDIIPIMNQAEEVGKK